MNLPKLIFANQYFFPGLRDLQQLSGQIRYQTWCIGRQQLLVFSFDNDILNGYIKHSSCVNTAAVLRLSLVSEQNALSKEIGLKSTKRMSRNV